MAVLGLLFVDSVVVVDNNDVFPRAVSDVLDEDVPLFRIEWTSSDWNWNPSSGTLKTTRSGMSRKMVTGATTLLTWLAVSELAVSSDDDCTEHIFALQHLQIYFRSGKSD